MDGQEIEIVAKEIEKNGQKYMKVYAKILSHPNKVDTDGDGYDDKSDINPLKWDISDRDLAMSADIVYHNIPKGTKFDKIRTSWKGTVNKRFDGVASIEELKGWSVLGTHYTNVGLQAAAFKKDNNIVVAYRG